MAGTGDLPQPLHAGDFYLRAIHEEMIGLRADIAALCALLAPRLIAECMAERTATEAPSAPQAATEAVPALASDDEGKAAERPAAKPAPSKPVAKAPAKAQAKRSTK